MAKFNKIHDMYVNVEHVDFYKAYKRFNKEEWTIWIEFSGDVRTYGEYKTQEECEKAIEDLIGWER